TDCALLPLHDALPIYALRAAIIAEERVVLAVLREVTDLLRPAQEAIAALHEMCVALDTLHARASWAADCNAEVPQQTGIGGRLRSEEHTSELQSRENL